MDFPSEDHNTKRDGPVDSKSGGMHNVAALGLVSFFTDFSTEMVLGVLPTKSVDIYRRIKDFGVNIESIEDGLTSIFGVSKHQSIFH